MLFVLALLALFLCRTQRCAACDGCFQEMHHHMHTLHERLRYPSLQTKARVFAQSLSDFYSK